MLLQTSLEINIDLMKETKMATAHRWHLLKVELHQKGHQTDKPIGKNSWSKSRTSK